MKLLHCLFLLLITSTAFAQDETIVPSEIECVSVFLQGAQITRTAETTVASGTSLLVFGDLSSSLDPSTIQLNSKGTFTVLSVNHRRNFEDTLAQTQAFTALQDDLLVLRDSLNYLQTLQEILKEKETFLKESKPSNRIDGEFSAETYRNTSTYYAEQVRDIRLELLSLDRQIRNIKEQFQQKLKASNERFGEEKDNPSEVIVKVQADRSTTASFTLTYLTPDASWTPSYDFKVNSIAEPIDIIYKANLQQTTGEDWNDVILTFSNANPTKSGQLPDLRPDYLNFGNRYARTRVIKKESTSINQAGRKIQGRIISASNGEPLIGASILFPKASVGTVTDIDGRFELTVPRGEGEITVSYTGYASQSVSLNSVKNEVEIGLEEGVMLSEVVVTGYGFSGRASGVNRARKQKKTEAYKAPPSTVQQKQTTVEFTLDVPYTTPSNGEVYTIIIAEDEMEANYAYQAIPKLEEAAYLNAKIANWTQYNLLSGDINLYFENTYVGKSNLDTSSPSDTLDISLGRDRSVQIERTEIDNFRKRRSIGNKQIDQRAYRLSIRNSKTEPINITLFDQVPISQNKDIEIEDIETSGGQLNEETGQVVWTLQLTPNEVVERTISYQVKYPKNRYVVVD